MITKQEILDRAREWRLRPDVVEKDYVLGWVLAAMSRHPEISRHWILKGGTCLKKCFLETYRFSEDLDFSLTPEAEYTADGMRRTAIRIAEDVRALSGIEMPASEIVVHERRDKLSRLTFQVRLPYRGPLAIPVSPRLLLDITQHEVIVDDPDSRIVLHPYPDSLPVDATIQTYSIEELMAEKTRALFERARPRDLYDVVYLAFSGEHLDFDRSRRIWLEKCRSKSLHAPSRAELVEIIRKSEEIRADWRSMIDHQLPEVVDVETFIERLPDALAWLDVAAAAAPALAAVPSRAGESAVGAMVGREWSRGLPLQVVRFAGANRLMVTFSYSGRTRTVEPYSFRMPQTGNLLLYAWERESGQVKAFNVAKMSDVRVTDRSFSPRYLVELTGVSATAPRRPRTSGSSRVPAAPARARSVGPIYKFRCASCGRKFRRKKNDPTLRRHTYPRSSAQCPGRRGYLVRMA